MAIIRKICSAPGRICNDDIEESRTQKQMMMESLTAKFGSLQQQGWNNPLLHAILVASVALIVYLNSFPGLFILDDVPIVRDNPLLLSFDLTILLRSDYWHGIANTGLYRPLTILSLALNRAVLGEAPWGFHLVNVLLHVAVTVMTWAVLRKWGFSSFVALFSGLLFAAHPMHTEVVDVVVGRSELLAAFFMLVALYAAREGNQRGTIVTLGAFSLALLSKEHAIALIPLLLVLEFFRDGVVRIRRQPGRYGGLLLITVLWLLWRKFGVVYLLPPQIPSAATTPLIFAPFSTRLLTGLLLQGLYLLKLLLPSGLQIYYTTTELPSLVELRLSVEVVIIAGVTLLVLGGVLSGWRRKSVIAFFLLAYFISFAPTANILLPIGVTFAERLSYFPSIWFCCAIAASAEFFSPRFQREVLGCLLLYLLFLGGLCLIRNHEYTNDIRLYRSEVQNNPRDERGWINYAESLACAGRLPEADAAYRTALQLAPDDIYSARSFALFLAVAGRRDEALTATQRAQELIAAQTDQVRQAHDLEALAQAYLELANPAKALELLDQAAGILNDWSRRPELRVRALSALGRHSEAVAAFASMKLDKPDNEVLYSYGVSLFQLGRLADAVVPLRRAVSEMESGEAWNLLGVIAAQQGDWSAAAQSFRRAVTLDPGNQHYRDNLAQAQSRTILPDRE